MREEYYKKIFINDLNVDTNLVNHIVENFSDYQIIEKIIEESFITLENFNTYIFGRYGIKCVEKIEKNNGLCSFIMENEEILIKNRVFPLFVNESEIIMASANLYFNEILNEDFKKDIKIYYAYNHVVEEKLLDFFGDKAKSEDTIDESKDLDALLKVAINHNASDIHIEPFDGVRRCRLRLNGHLQEVQFFTEEEYNKVVSKIKYLSKIDITKKLIPQDGHFESEFYRKKYDFRVSSLPTLFGEKIVIRIIYKSVELLNTKEIGFEEDDLVKLNKLFKEKSGIILVTGPTGSGKTTTLYSFINELNTNDVNITTIEEPIENVIMGINQVGLNFRAGLNFNNVLHFLLRQDPDIIMVGEIRDYETARLSFTSSITGHLVLSTLHTNNAVATVLRLVDMGIDNYLITSSLKAIISQRLIRRVCESCKEVDVNASFNGDFVIYKSVGCSRCNYTGYSGRFLVYELLILDDEFRVKIKGGSTESELNKYLVEKGFISIRKRAENALKEGKTTANEIEKLFLY
ncbi:MAG: GspE/PulE family protein [Lachnospirales bacterium]